MSRLPILARFAANRRRRQTVELLSALSDAQLADAGIRRFDIPRLAMEATPAATRAAAARPAIEAGGLSFAG